MFTRLLFSLWVCQCLLCAVPGTCEVSLIPPDGERLTVRGIVYIQLCPPHTKCHEQAWLRGKEGYRLSRNTLGKAVPFNQKMVEIVGALVTSRIKLSCRDQDPEVLMMQRASDDDILTNCRENPGYEEERIFRSLEIQDIRDISDLRTQ